MSKNKPVDSKRVALSRILEVVANKSARFIAYATATLGMMYLVPELELPPELAAIASGIGIEMLGSIIDRVASGKGISDEEIKQAVEDAIAQSGIDELLTKEDFYHAFAQLRKGQRTLQALGNENVRMLHRLESTVLAALAQEASPEELQSIQERIRGHLHRQIAKEKNCKRYIPDIFVEVACVKDKARFFAHPVLFLNKVVEDIGRLNLSRLNVFLLKLSLEPISLDLSVEAVNGIDEVEGQLLRLLDALQHLRDRLSPYSSLEPKSSLQEIIPADRRYIYQKIWFPLGGTASAFIRQVDERIDDLKAIQARVLFIVAKAGQGKTNFVCDFAENVLGKRSIPCLFFTGQELRYEDPDRIDEYIVDAVFGDRYDGSMETMLKDLQELCLLTQTHVTIIIDGINEHSNVNAFSRRLETLIERILEHRFIKVILTCRSEYFDQRFDNLRRASFAQETYLVEGFERCMSSIHKDHLLDAYLSFFNLGCPYLSTRAADTLQRDTLLLRIFCEAYGDHNATEVIQLPQIMDIYKDKVFRIYLDRKLDEASKRQTPSIGAGTRYRQALNQVIQLMVQREQFANIPVADLSPEYYTALEEMINEGLIFRKDLVEGRSALDEESEVINFTFDEFRDFLLADHLTMVTFKEDAEAFNKKVEHFIDATSPVAEGVSKYIFFASKRPECRDVYTAIAETSWYKMIFSECIFSVEEDLITERDLTEIRSVFFEDTKRSNEIIHSLIRRWQTELYPTLNITLLFEILDELDESAYDELVKPAFSMPMWWHTTHWPIEKLGNNIRDILMDQNAEDLPDLENLAELLVYLFGIEGPDGNLPAYEVFEEYAESKTDIAIQSLERHIHDSNSQIVAQVWRMLADLSRRGKLPKPVADDLIDKASQLLSGENPESAGRSHLWAIRSFLLSCEIEDSAY